ncbi:hypothetical protein Ancab_026357 [Ancistrocladus abbreviatus]
MARIRTRPKVIDNGPYPILRLRKRAPTNSHRSSDIQAAASPGQTESVEVENKEISKEHVQCLATLREETPEVEASLNAMGTAAQSGMIELKSHNSVVESSAQAAEPNKRPRSSVPSSPACK